MKPKDDRNAGKRPAKPNIVHPTIPGAVGSMESPYREGRDTVEESKMIIDDAIGRIDGEKPAS